MAECSNGLERGRITMSEMNEVEDREVDLEPDDKSADVPALRGAALVKEVSRLIREAKKRWDAHENASCRRVRSQALRLYMTMTEVEKDQVPQVLRVWLRYRSVKYFGPQGKGKKKRKPPGRG
jgi:hypothetical protein